MTSVRHPDLRVSPFFEFDRVTVTKVTVRNLKIRGAGFRIYLPTTS